MQPLSSLFCKLDPFEPTLTTVGDGSHESRGHAQTQMIMAMWANIACACTSDDQEGERKIALVEHAPLCWPPRFSRDPRLQWVAFAPWSDGWELLGLLRGRGGGGGGGGGAGRVCQVYPLKWSSNAWVDCARANPWQSVLMY